MMKHNKLLTTKTVVSEATLVKAYETKQLVSYKTVQYSLNTLNELCDLLSKKAAELGIFQIARYEQYNCISVSVDTKEQQEAVLATIPIALQDAVKVEVGGAHPINTATTHDIEGGNRILNNDKGSAGTVGFNAYNYSTGKYGIVTNNHVATSTNRMSKWIQYGSNAGQQIPINDHSGTNSKIRNNTCPELDASFVPFFSTTGTSGITWTTSNKLRTQYGKDTGASYCTVSGIISNSQFIVGTPVTKIGYTTGKQYGTITSVSSYAGSVSGGGFLTNHYIQSGDSGGPIYYCTSNGDYLVGITNAKSNDYTTWATKIKPAMFTLSLDLIGSAKKYRIGDVDGNGTVNAADADMALRAAVNIITLTSTQWEAADIDMSKSVTSSDARKILQKVNGENLW